MSVDDKLCLVFFFQYYLIDISRDSISLFNSPRNNIICTKLYVTSRKRAVFTEGFLTKYVIPWYLIMLSKHSSQLSTMLINIIELSKQKDQPSFTQKLLQHYKQHRQDNFIIQHLYELFYCICRCQVSLKNVTEVSCCQS